jgi:hypothetical protein
MLFQTTNNQIIKLQYILTSLKTTGYKENYNSQLLVTNQSHDSFIGRVGPGNSAA